MKLHFSEVTQDEFNDFSTKIIIETDIPIHSCSIYIPFQAGVEIIDITPKFKHDGIFVDGIARTDQQYRISFASLKGFNGGEFCEIDFTSNIAGIIFPEVAFTQAAGEYTKDGILKFEWLPSKAILVEKTTLVPKEEDREFDSIKLLAKLRAGSVKDAG